MWTATGRNTHVLGRRTAVGPNGSFGKFNMFGAISGRDRSSVPDQFRPGPIFRSFKRRQVLAPTAAARATELLTASALSTCGRDISSTQHLRRFWVISGVSHCQCEGASARLWVEVEYSTVLRVIHSIYSICLYIYIYTYTHAYIHT